MAGNMYLGNTRIKKIWYVDENSNVIQIKKGYVSNDRIYSAGNIVTYKVDTNVSYQEEVDMDATCLSPRTFTPTKSGWTFVGWREDSVASSDVLSSKVMGDNPITLYAVFSLGVTITKYNGSNTATTETKQRYYNNNNYNNPSFTLTENGISGWSPIGWTNNSGAYTATIANGGSTGALTSNATYYSLYTSTITVTYYNNSTAPSTKTGTRVLRYTTSTSYSNPAFSLSEAGVDGWSARGWSTSNEGSAGITYGNGATFYRDSNITLYSLYYRGVTITYYNSGSASSASGTAYRNASGSVTQAAFTLYQAGVGGWSARGWSTSNSGNAGITYNNGATFYRDTNITLYSLYQRTVTVSYNGNGATSGGTGASYGTAYRNATGDIINTTISLAGNGFAKSGWTYKGWGTTSDALYMTTSYTGYADVTMYAIWKQSFTLKSVVDNAYFWNFTLGSATGGKWTANWNDGVQSLQIEQGGNDYCWGTYYYTFDRKNCDSLVIKYQRNSQITTITFGSASTTLERNESGGTVTLNLTGQAQVNTLQFTMHPDYKGDKEFDIYSTQCYFG